MFFCTHSDPLIVSISVSINIFYAHFFIITLGKVDRNGKKKNILSFAKIFLRSLQEVSGGKKALTRKIGDGNMFGE